MKFDFAMNIDQASSLRRLAASVLVARIARAQADEHGVEDEVDADELLDLSRPDRWEQE